MSAFPDAYLPDVVARFRELKSLADRSLSRMSDENFLAQPGRDTNSIALIVKHLAGNLRSRWSEMLTSDGEKPDRNRDGEFEWRPVDSREGAMQSWEQGWQILFDTLGSLSSEDLERAITIRGERHHVYQAINRQLIHYGQHVGQIVLLARQLYPGTWESLSIPRGQSEQFNARKRSKT